MCPVPDHKRLYAEARQCLANTRPALAVSRVGFHGPSAQIERLQLSTSRHVAGTFATYDYTCDCFCSHMAILHGDHKTPWNAAIDHVQLRPKVHFQILEGITLTHGDETPHVDFVPSTNGWSDGMVQPFHQPSVVGTSPQQSK